MILTLLTDWGTKDATAAVAKATLMRYLPDANIVDISHNVARQSQRQAAYLLTSFYNSFPAGTIHIIPVAAFVGKAPCMLLAEHDSHYFIAPDNGLLPLIFGEATNYTVRNCYNYSTPYNFTQWLHDAGSIAKQIANGDPLPAAGFIPQRLKQMPLPQLTNTGIECHVLYTDRYGNVVLNFSRDDYNQLLANKPFSIQTMKGDNITTLSTQYNDVPNGMPLCRLNKMGMLEIAVNHGTATELLGFEAEDITNLRYNTVRIFV